MGQVLVARRHAAAAQPNSSPAQPQKQQEWDQRRTASPLRYASAHAQANIVRHRRNLRPVLLQNRYKSEQLRFQISGKFTSKSSENLHQN
jgi:hypothetical protein